MDETTPNDPTPRGDETAKDAGFAALGLDADLVAALAKLGYEEPTPIQRESIPLLLSGRDLLGQAATGTGKTAAFALPLLQRIGTASAVPARPRALVLVPTRELAMQVAEAIHRYGKGRNAGVLPIYGGQSISTQLRALSRGVSTVVATPGRALDHVDRGTLKLDDVTTVVLDEADEMLDMGFAEDLEAILGRTPPTRQTALFSATLAPRILALANRHLRDPVQVSIARERTPEGEAPRVRQVAYVVTRAQKPQALGRVLDMEAPSSAIVFCRTRLEVDDLTEAMNAHGFAADALHGGYAQERRDRVMARFRSGKTDLLIATDVAARGLDIQHVSHVVNFDVPSEPDVYVHRIGRTGRAGREGVAITFVEPREHRMLRAIQGTTGQRIATATLPTVADLRHRRLERTRVALQETVLAGDLDLYRDLVVQLSTEHDPMDVAAAAVRLAHLAEHPESGDEDDLAPPSSHSAMPSGARPSRAPRERERPNVVPPRAATAPSSTSAPRPTPNPTPAAASERAFVKIFVGAGRLNMLRPADLVGAITNEAGLRADRIGAIELGDRSTLVEVPAADAERVIAALQNTTLRGRKVVVRHDRPSS